LAKLNQSRLGSLLGQNRLQKTDSKNSLMRECNELGSELPGFSGRKIEGNFESIHTNDLGKR